MVRPTAVVSTTLRRRGLTEEAAVEHGYRVKYLLATRLVNELVEAADEK